MPPHRRIASRLGTSADYTQVSFICPFCGDRSTGDRFDRHMAKQHPGVSEDEMRQAIQAGLRDSSIRFELSGKRENQQSGTKALAREKLTNKLGVRTVVQGGAPGLKKSRT